MNLLLSRFTRLVWGVLTLIGTLALGLYLATVAWSHFGPEKPILGPLRKAAADELLPSVVADLRQHAGQVQSIALLPLTNDPTDYVTDELRRQLEESGAFEVRDRPLDEKVCRALNLAAPVPRDIAQAVARARGVRAEAVVFGRIPRFVTQPQGARLELDLTLVHLPTREILLDRQYAKEFKFGLLEPPMLAAGLGQFSPAQRFVGWALAVLLLPVFTIAFLRATVRRESNGLNAVALSVYTATDALLALFLLGSRLGSGLTVLVFLLLVAVAFAYNLFLMSFALRLET